MDELYQNQWDWQAFLGILDRIAGDYSPTVCLLEGEGTGVHRESHHLTSG